MKNLVSFFGLERGIVGMLLMCILIGLGEKMAERFLPIYLIALGGGPLMVGLLNSLDNLLSALYSYPGGWLTDKIGTKRALLVFNGVAIFGFLIVLLIPSYWAVLLGSFFFISWTALSLPATMSLISEVLPKQKRTMGVSVHSLVRRIPMALGPLIGGTLITMYGKRDGVWWAFVAALGMALLAIVFQQFMIEEKKPAKEDPAASPIQPDDDDQPLISEPLRKLLVADILIRFCEQIPYPFVVIWCLENNGLSGIDFGILTAVEMLVAMLIYIPVAWLADSTRKKPFVVMTFVFFTIFPIVLMFSKSFWPLVIAFILRGLKEFGEPTRKALILDLAPEGRKAAAFGKYYLWRDSIVAVGAFTGAFLWQHSPELNFVVAFMCGLAGTLWFALKGKELSPL